MVQELKAYDKIFGHTVTLVVVADTDGAYDGSQLSFDATNIRVIAPTRHDIPGKMVIKGLGMPTVIRGDVLQVTGKVYKTRGSKQAGMSYATGYLMTRNITTIQKIRLWFGAGVRNAVPEPQSSFGIGLLIGQRTGLTKEVSDDLSRVGLTHIVAVSGYNLTIIIEFARLRLGKKSKYQATVWSLLLMTIFVLITGWSASIVRAVIVSTMSLAAWYYGRNFRPLVLILLAATATALWNPLYIWSDVGWYLSFLAFYGVLVLAPLIMQRRERKGKRKTTLNALIIESYCAQIMTLPIIMYIFHRLSVVGLISNVLVVPLVPIGMLFTLVAGVVGSVTPAVSGWFGLPARFVLSYMIQCARYFAAWRHASVDQALSSQMMVALYVGLAICSFILWRHVVRSATITDTETNYTELHS